MNSIVSTELPHNTSDFAAAESAGDVPTDASVDGPADVADSGSEILAPSIGDVQQFVTVLGEVPMFRDETSQGSATTPVPRHHHTPDGPAGSSFPGPENTTGAPTTLWSFKY